MNLASSQTYSFFLQGIKTLHMENKIITRHENAKETSGGNRYHIFDEKTIVSYLYHGNCEVRAIDVRKLRRKAEGEQGMKF